MMNADLRKALLASGLFDPVWYATEYPDVAMTGLDPLEHFLTAGMLMGRDPGPDFSEAFIHAAAPDLVAADRTALQEWLESGGLDLPRHRVMLGAVALASQGRSDDAMRLARRFLGDQAERPLRLFAANKAMQADDEQGWLSHLNDYLAPYAIAPLRLRPGQSLLHRLHTDPIAQKGGGPLVSIIMPAFRSETSVEVAADSILRQSWANLELLIVDDASDDGTWAALQRLAARDSRVRIRRNSRNLGPYVSKNLALLEARGEFVTGHDADDWAHPQRIENHMSAVLASQGAIKAGTNMMLRVNPAGLFDNVTNSSPHHSPDGIRRRAFISCLFEREAMQRQLGFYDCVRFGADGEMLRRAQKVLGPAFHDFDLFAMICMDSPDGLTNDPEHGLRTADGVSATRRHYNASWGEWHRQAAAEDLWLPFLASERPFPAPSQLQVPQSDIAAVLHDRETGRG